MQSTMWVLMVCGQPRISKAFHHQIDKIDHFFLVKMHLNPSSAIRIFCRQKTFRATPTKAFRKVLADIKYRKAAGLEPRPSAANLKETKFFKVVGPMKIYTSLSPGLTNRRHPTRFHLWKKSCVKRLSYGKRSTGGRNNTGRITVRHRGGGHKKRVRIIDFKRNDGCAHRVERFEYDPNRNGELMLMRNLSTNELSYVIRPIGVEVGQVIYNYGSRVPAAAPGQEVLSKAELLKDGNCLPIRSIPVGTYIHCIGLSPNGPAKLCRAAGTFAQILSVTPSGHCQLKLCRYY